MKTFITVCMLLGGLSPSKDSGCLRIDVLIIADVSGSIHGHEKFLNYALQSFVDSLDISDDGIHAGIIIFADKAKVMCPLTGDHDKFDDGFTPVRADLMGGTNMSSSFDMALEEFSRNGRGDVHRMIVVISDGDTINKDKTLQIAQQMEIINVLICAVMIINSSSDEEFMKELSGKCYLQSSYQNLFRVLEKMDFCL